MAMYLIIYIDKKLVHHNPISISPKPYSMLENKAFHWTKKYNFLLVSKVEAALTTLSGADAEAN